MADVLEKLEKGEPIDEAAAHATTACDPERFREFAKKADLDPVEELDRMSSSRTLTQRLRDLLGQIIP